MLITNFLHIYKKRIKTMTLKFEINDNGRHRIVGYVQGEVFASSDWVSYNSISCLEIAGKHYHGTTEYWQGIFPSNEVWERNRTMKNSEVRIELKSKNARDASKETRKLFPPNQAISLTGYDSEGECVYISLVREKGNKAPVATAKKSRSANVFYAYGLDRVYNAKGIGQ